MHICHTFTRMIFSLGHSMVHASYLHKYLWVHTNTVLKRTWYWLYRKFMSKLTSRVHMHMCNTFAHMIISLGYSIINASYFHKYYWCTPILFWLEPDTDYIDDSCLNQPQEYKCTFVIYLHKWLSLLCIVWSMQLICTNIYWYTSILFWKEPDTDYVCDSCLNQPQEYKWTFAMHLDK